MAMNGDNTCATGPSSSASPASTPLPWRRRATIRRLILTLLVIGQTGFASSIMVRVLPYHGDDPLEMAMIVVFTLLFFGISVGSWFAIYGFIVSISGGDPLSLRQRHPPDSLTHIPLARTAIIIPIYHEPIERTFGGIEAIYRSLAATALIEHFDFFILSDSRDPEVWLSEQSAWYRLCKLLQADGRLFYRRRLINLKYKSGNIADFLRRWGRNYRYTLVLDADSLMSGSTIVQMVRTMEVEPSVGILQTCPALIRAESLFARVHQFANHCYGPIFTTGLAALQLGEASYWGHNALLRNEPFMQHCGLKHLPGSGLFGGAILSHDFVEAALMVRGGYEVWLEPQLTGTFEESPPTLVEDLARDRRWAKGNLQHLWLLFFGKKIRTAHRLAFLNGAMSYLASPLWLIFLALSTVAAARLALEPINYFPAGNSPYPRWPEWHPGFAIALASSTAFLLILPKFLAIFATIWSGKTSNFGGISRLLLSIVMETLVSSLLAPIRMLSHSRFVGEALVNINLRWAGQNRSNETGWQATMANQLPGSLIALAWAAFAYRLDYRFFLWSLPVVIPLVLAVPVSLLLGRVSIGRWVRQIGLLCVGEELHGCALVDHLRHPATTSARTDGLTAFAAAIIDPGLNRLHQSLARRRRGGNILGLLDALRRRCLKDGPEGLSAKERGMLASDQESLEWLHHASWQEGRGSSWAKFHPTEPFEK